MSTKGHEKSKAHTEKQKCIIQLEAHHQSLNISTKSNQHRLKFMPNAKAEQVLFDFPSKTDPPQH